MQAGSSQSSSSQGYQPSLGAWSHLWRTTVCLAISGLTWGEIAGVQLRDRPWLFVADLGVGLASFVLVLFRRRWPFPIAVLLQACALVSASSAGPATLALVSLATRRRIGEIATAGAVGILCSQLFATFEPQRNGDPLWVDLAFLTITTIAVCLAGMYIGSRRELIWSLRERARHAEAERDLRVEQARSAERERIAREMHDVLAHRISLVTMHAGALAYRTDLPVEQVRESAAVIQAAAHEALQDLRQVLGTLRGQSDDDRPQPTLDDLPALVAQARAGGDVVDYGADLVGTPADAIGRTVYRIVQEGLTNARKHAWGTHVTVRIAGSAENGITVTVRNAKPVGMLGRASSPASGFGLVGLRERTDLVSGSLTVHDRPGEFVLTAWVPWET